MRLGDRRWWLGAASLLLVLLLFVADLERAAPGPLAPPHAASPELVEAGGCQRCHGRRGETMASACSACHREIADQLAGGSGFHGSLPEERAGACGSCHLEHHGAEAPLVGALAFALAGGERARFDHGHVTFQLTGAHADLECAACHEHADAAFLAAGQTRFLGLSQECAACHRDPHEGSFVRGCETCHGQERPFAAVASFVHGGAFPLVGAHARPRCLDCHAAGSSHSVEALAGSGPPPEARACADCHASPHDAGFVAGVSALATVDEGASCALCHDAAAGSFAAVGMDEAWHAASGFVLEAPHAGLACEACHDGGPSSAGGFAERFPGRSADACEGCHADPHAGQFAEGPFAREGCLACHERRRFTPHAFDAAAHERTTFALRGLHAAAACNECHLNVGADGVRAFRGTPSACSACHADAHRGELLAFETDRGCATCHVPSGFGHVERESFAHGARTGFELDGAHASAACEACHLPRPRADELGRVFGRVAETFPGPVERCETCHADPHRGAFAGRDGVQGRAGCARCHVTDDFRRLRGDCFDHGLWTGFALEGAHDAIACGACHGDARPGSARSLGFVDDVFGAVPRRCESCHADVHAGRFDGPGRPELVAGRVGCARCHDVESFRLAPGAPFDHDLWTGWALEGPHARADCAACHVVPRAETPGTTLGFVPGRACADCHADPHAGQFRAAGATDCARCHLVGEDFRARAFDHARDARFALDETHAALDCGACHVPWSLPDGGAVVRYRPLGTSCVDCHAIDGGAGGGR